MEFLNQETGCIATTDELRAEAMWSTRGGWAVWLGGSEDEIAANNAVLTFVNVFVHPPLVLRGILLQGGESQGGAMSAGPRSYRNDSTESGDAFGDVDIDERERSKVLGAIKAKVAGHYGRR